MHTKKRQIGRGSTPRKGVKPIQVMVFMLITVFMFTLVPSIRDTASDITASVYGSATATTSALLPLTYILVGFAVLIGVSIIIDQS